MKTFILAAAALATLAGGTAIAHAQSQNAPMPADSKKMRDDKNRDGVISRDEALAAAGRKFDKKDRNKDGKLDQAELAKKGKSGKRMASSDMSQPYDDQ